MNIKQNASESRKIYRYSHFKNWVKAAAIFSHVVSISHVNSHALYV